MRSEKTAATTLHVLFWSETCRARPPRAVTFAAKRVRTDDVPLTHVLCALGHVRCFARSRNTGTFGLGETRVLRVRAPGGRRSRLWSRPLFLCARDARGKRAGA